MDSEGDYATLNFHRTPCGWESRYERLKKIIGREVLSAMGLSCVFEVPMLFPQTKTTW
jgi:hypothetical protein